MRVKNTIISYANTLEYIYHFKVKSDILISYKWSILPKQLKDCISSQINQWLSQLVSSFLAS